MPYTYVSWFEDKSKSSYKALRLKHMPHNWKFGRLYFHKFDLIDFGSWEVKISSVLVFIFFKSNRFQP